MSPVPIQNRTSGIDTAIQLYDSDIKEITEGPLAWANARQGTRRDINDFVNELTERFNKIGLQVEIQVWKFGECKCVISSHTAEQCPNLAPVDDAWMFQGMITGRIEQESGFDFDRMVHEVQNNLLEIPGEGGSIKFDEAEFHRQMDQFGRGHHH